MRQRIGHFWWSGVLLLLAVASPATALAGETPVRKGFWWSFGGGYGSAHMQCDRCLVRAREGSFSGWGRLGGTLAGGKLLLGWEGSGWLSNARGSVLTHEDVTRTLGNSDLIAVYYPFSRLGAFVKVGAGVAYAGLPPRPKEVCPTAPLSATLACFDDQDEGAHASGPGMIAGVGYDFRVRSKMSITSELSFSSGQPGDLRGGTTLANGWKHDIVAFGVGLTFH